MQNPFLYFNSSSNIIRLTVMMYVWFPLSLRQVEDLLSERDRRAALRFLKRAVKRYGRPASTVTDGLPSYRAAMTVIGNAAPRPAVLGSKNRAENSHQPFQRREGAMAKFRDVKTVQKFAVVHASIHNHFNHQRHLNRRDIFKHARAAALAEWRQLAA